MKKSLDALCPYLFAAILLLCATFVHGQVQVAMSPVLHFQFLSTTGVPLANGYLYTYAAGTTTQLNTYVDSTGTVQNSDPILLDSTGAPSNGTTQTGIWLANTAYKFCAFNSVMVQQWCTDNVTGYLGLLNLANTWTFQQTFSQPIVDTSTDTQLVFGSAGNQTTVDFPPPTGNIVLHAPNINDTLVGTLEPATVENKTLITPLFNTSGCGIVNGPATYSCIANASPTGTTLYSLAKWINAPSQATIAATTDTGGIQGICVAGCGTTGNATIQQNGLALCAFDAATTANDYVQISSTVAGGCHDTGLATYPQSGQVIGKVLSTNATSGNYQVEMFGPEVAANSVHTIYAAASQGSTFSNVATEQIIGTPPSFQAGVLNQVNKAFRMQANFLITPATAINSFAYFGFGTSSALGTWEQIVEQGASSAQLYVNSIMNCVVATTGTSGTLFCTVLTTSSASSSGVVIGPYFQVTTDLTQPLYVAPGCSFSTASASNNCAAFGFTVEQLN
jgi:hypothetical protein